MNKFLLNFIMILDIVYICYINLRKYENNYGLKVLYSSHTFL